MKNFAKGLINRLYEVKLFAPFESIIEAVESAVVGKDDKTLRAPHIRDNIEIKRFMSCVIIGLLPAVFASIYFYGLRAIAIILVSYTAGGVVEVAFSVFRGKEIHEGFLVTGLIFPLILPPDIPLWTVAVGIVFATFFGKEVFGGTGRNIFNPALVGRLFITISFPTIMTTYREPLTDAVTTATPLSIFRTSAALTSYSDLLWGFAPGSMGETFRIGLIAGGLFLLVTKVSGWRIPFTYFLTVFILAALGNTFFPEMIAPPIFQLLTGGLLLGGFFMATDPVSSAFTYPGQYIFGFGCGFLTVLIRSFSGFTEGVMFSIVLMNALAPLIDELVLRFKYPEVLKKL